MIKKIDANKYGVVRYAISSIEDIADLPREVSVGSEAILVNEDGEKKFRLGSDGWVEVVEVKEYDEDKLRDMLEDAKVGYGGIEYETLEERLDKDFDNVYSVLDNRTYVEYGGCRITAKDSLNGLQKETVVKGRTLQNLVPMGLFESHKAENWNVLTNGHYSFDNGYLTLNCREDGYVNAYPNIGNMFKANTVYTMVLDLKENTLVRDSGATFVFSTGRDTELFIETMNASQIKKGLNVFKLTTHSDLTNAIYIARTFIYNNVTSGHITFRYAIFEGDHTQTLLEELPYIEGIESVGDKSKNLFNSVLLNNKINNTTGIIIDRYSNEHYSSDFIQCDSLKTYTASINYNDTVSEVMLFEYDNEKNFIKKNSEIGTNSLTTTLSNNTKYIRLSSFKGYGFNEYNFDFQIEEGAQATAYEPYYDGYKISGKSCGKNLIDLSKMIPHAKIDHKIEGNKVILVGNEPYPYVLTKIPIDVRMISGKRLRMSADSITSTSEINQKVRLLQLNVTYLDGSMAYHGVMTGKKDQIFTLGKNIAYAYVCFYTNNTENYEMGKTVIINPMLEIQENDSTPILYEPYKESTYSYILDEPLRSLPNGICDEIDLEKGVVTRRVGKVVLDGSESWVEDPSEGTMRFAVYQGLPNAKNTVNRECIISDNFFDMSKGEHTFNGAFHYKTHLFLYKDLASVSDFKQWLQTNPTTVYYELAEPTTEYLIKDDKFVTLPNGVKDEISHNSVLRKVGKIVLDGSSDENWKVWNTSGENVYKFVIPMINLKLVGGNPLLCNNFKYLSSASTDEEGIYNGNTGGMGLKISKTKLTNGSTDEFREWLALNPITVYYELETPYVEPINLDEVILDTIRLKSYEPITHITSDNYLPPTIKTQVPSDFNAVVLGLKSDNETLASQVMSLRQTNDELEATNREQDDVIDVTLLALDEVYGMIDEGEIEAMSIGSPMVNVYVKMIKRGIKTLDEVPAKYRAEVEELI